MSNVIDNPRPNRWAKQQKMKHSAPKQPATVRKLRTAGRDPRSKRR